MPKLFWFHAFRRDQTSDAMHAVRTGFIPVPSLSSKTSQLELQLDMRVNDMRVNNVYCYLGRTRDAFGDFAVVFEQVSDSDACISPFDTGGLIDHCRPVCDWSDEERNRYLQDYTWTIDELGTLLQAYPGNRFLEYLDTSAPPLHSGPHHIWEGRMEADIWTADQHWCSWTWECRVPTKLNAREIIAWTCSAPRFKDILLMQQEADDVTASWLTSILAKYVEGGVGFLVKRMTEIQAQ